jgi:hypothetical protein
MQFKRLLPVMAALVLLILVIAACGSSTTPCPTAAACPTFPDAAACPTAAACTGAPACPTAEACPTCPEPVAGVTTTAAACPYQDVWAASAHADKAAEAFNHWNEDDPKEVPTGCATCHSTSGFQDYVGADGSAVGVVDKAAPIGEVVSCNACHNDAVLAFDVMPFPSGITVTVTGPENRCMICHQGRASGATVDAAIAKQAPADDDTVVSALGFTNIHYKAAAATQYGTEVKGGYEYEGKAYDPKFGHVEGLNTCTACHNQHSLEVRLETCTMCHTDVKTVDDLKHVREPSMSKDYDGDGNVTEGIYYEIEGLQEILLKGIQMYATEVSTGAIAYDAAAYPYFFYDKDANGKVDQGEPGFKGWTGRLLKAAYNYQLSIKDPGAFAHNPSYIIELLYDSTEDLNTKLSAPIDLSKAHRVDAGHFDGSAMAFRDWDAEGEVPGGCARCHSADGLPTFIKNAATIATETITGFQCSTCHDESAFPALYDVASVPFPSGASVTFEDTKANICIECHQGRQSTVSVNKALKDLEPDTVSDKIRFLNVHYFAAGATLFGSDVQGAYQYEGKEYLGQFQHVAGFNTCINCHSAHELGVQVDACSACHPVVKTAEDLKLIRMSTTDYDGDGNTTEGIFGEHETLEAALYAAIQNYATKTAGTPLVYSASAYPYYFADANANGQIDEGEVAYASWTPRLLKAAYNYQYVQKDPGDYAHNGRYVIQFLYDSIQDLGGDVSKYTRP